MRRHLPTRVVLSEELLEPLVRRTLEGDEHAWQELWLTLAPVIDEVAGRWRLAGRLAGREDERRDIVVRVMAKLRANGFERLALLHAILLRREGSGVPWILVMAKRAALSHARWHAEYLGDGEGERRWAELLPLPEGMEETLPISIRAASTTEAHRVDAFAARELGREAFEALRLWLGDCDHREIAAQLGLPDAHAADRLVRNALKHLRRHLMDQDAAREP